MVKKTGATVFLSSVCIFQKGFIFINFSKVSLYMFWIISLISSMWTMKICKMPWTTLTQLFMKRSCRIKGRYHRRLSVLSFKVIEGSLKWGRTLKVMSTIQWMATHPTLDSRSASPNSRKNPFNVGLVLSSHWSHFSSYQLCCLTRVMDCLAHSPTKQRVTLILCDWSVYCPWLLGNLIWIAWAIINGQRGLEGLAWWTKGLSTSST